MDGFEEKDLFEDKNDGKSSESLPAEVGFDGDEFRTYDDTEADRPPVREEVRYEEIFDRSKPKSRGFSVASLVLGIFSTVCCCFGWGVLVMGIMAVVFAIISRKTLGYFDGLSIAGLILGIFGAVFGIFSIYLTYGPMADMLEEILKEMENIQGGQEF